MSSLKHRVFRAKTRNEMLTLGKEFTEELTGRDILLLFGSLGAGKTTFVKGIAEGLGVIEEITSPTFTLLQVYPVLNNPHGIHSLVHIDTYRLSNEEELRAIGVEDYLGKEGYLTVVEWGGLLRDIIKNKRVIRINIETNEQGIRIIRVNHDGGATAGKDGMQGALSSDETILSFPIRALTAILPSASIVLSSLSAV